MLMEMEWRTHCVDGGREGEERESYHTWKFYHMPYNASRIQQMHSDYRIHGFNDIFWTGQHQPR